MAIGLERGERCLYIGEDNSIAYIFRKLEEHGVDVNRARKEDALRVLTKHETYLRHGSFEPHKMIDDLCKEVQAAVDLGFSGLRAAGELSWALDLPSALAQIVKYEEELEERFYGRQVLLCQYDESRYPAPIIERMKSLHPVVVCDGKIIRRSSKRRSAVAA